MPFEITMPQLSDTMTEGTLVKWLKAEGDAVAEGEMVAEVETDKATMEMEAGDEAGTLAAVLAGEGDKVAVGDAIGVLALKGEDAAAIKRQYAKGGKSGAKADATSDAKPLAEPASAGGSAGTSGSGQAPATTADKADAAPAGKEADVEKAGVNPTGGATATMTGDEGGTPNGGGGVERHQANADYGGPNRLDMPMPVAADDHSESNGNGAAGGRIIASPLAKKIAADKGVDLASLTGTGPNGRIVQKDVLDFLDKPKPAPAPAAPPAAAEKPATKPAPVLPQRVATGQTERVELTKMRATIAQRLQQSKQTIPHFYEVVDIDMAATNALRATLNKSLEREKVRLSVGDLIAKAVATTLKAHPALNATFDGTTVTRHGDVNLGMAVALPEGLIVPVLRNIDQMGLKEIRQRSADLVDRARGQKLKRDEMSGATFTVSNLGTYGVREFSAIVNPPEVGILAIGSGENRAVVRDGQVVARPTMTVTLSADHRVVDGATAAEFLRTLRAMLEEPGMMLV